MTELKHAAHYAVLSDIITPDLGSRGFMITTKEFDEKFDNGEDILEYLDFSSARRINQESQSVNIDLPQWVVNRLDDEAKRIGVSRQALVKMWIVEQFEKV